MEKYNSFLDIVHRIEEFEKNIPNLKTVKEVDAALIEMKDMLDTLILKVPYIYNDIDEMYHKQRAEINARRMANFGK